MMGGGIMKKLAIFIAILFFVACAKTSAPLDPSNSLGKNGENSVQVFKEGINLCEENKSCACASPGCALICEPNSSCSCSAEGCMILCDKGSECRCSGPHCQIDCEAGAKSCECNGKDCLVVHHERCEDNATCSCKEDSCTVACGVGGRCQCTGANCITTCADKAQCQCTGAGCTVYCVEGGICSCSGEGCLSVPVKIVKKIKVVHV